MPRREPQIKSGTLGALNANFDVNVSDIDAAALFITGTFVGTITLYGSDDGTNFVPIAGYAMDAPATPVTTVAVNKGYNINVYPHKTLRATMTAYTSGTANLRASSLTR